MKNKSILIILSSVLLSLSPLSLIAANNIVVVVHPGNSIKTMTQDEIKRIYLGKNKLFKNGLSVAPVDAEKGSLKRKEFYKKVVGKSPSQVSSYWSRLIFTGKGAPPRVIDSEAEILAWVESHADSIGYVNKDSVTDTVKIVFTLP